ncbi:MAG: Hsp20/alpha crystallin family protein [Alphaproteobacteria bacterium]|nr:Hsp20/alpha crystallin family protein [Alphaproteobacteria bacterium]
MKSMISSNTRSGSGEMMPFGRNSEFNHLMNYFWNYFDTTGSVSEGSSITEIEPHLQIVETKSAVNITAELPGIEEKDLDLQVSPDGYLSVCGEKKNIVESKDKDAYFSEISYGTFKRTVPLPWDLDYDHVTAAYKNGVLNVSIPKLPAEKQKFKKIAINSGADVAQENMQN